MQGALGYVRVYGVPITKDMLARSASRSSAPVTALAAPELMAAYRFDAGTGDVEGLAPYRIAILLPFLLVLRKKPYRPAM